MTSHVATIPERPATPALSRARPVETLTRHVRLALRNAYATALSRVPDAWLLPIRSAYVAAPAGSVRRRLTHRALRCIRYRHPHHQLDWFTLPDAPDVRLANVNSIIVRHLYWFGLYGWESTEVHAWRHFCGRAARIVEIGANIGFYTVCGAQRATGASYTAVEPHPHTSGVLQRNLALNGLDRVALVPAAVVGRKTADRMTLLVPSADQDDAPPGSFLASGGEISRPAMTSHDVPVVEARELLAGVDLLKLDVEGYEFEILNAGHDLLLASRPVIFVEVLEQSTRLQRLVGDLAWSHQYRVYVCGRTFQEVDPADVSAGRLRRRHHTRDVVLVPAECSDLPGPSGYQ